MEAEGSTDTPLAVDSQPSTQSTAAMDTSTPAEQAAREPLAPRLASYNQLLTFKADSLKKVRKEKAWQEQPRYFKNVKLSVTAGTKMLKHAMEGVKKGRERNGTPIEIMGLLFGRPATADDSERATSETSKAKGAERKEVAKDRSREKDRGEKQDVGLDTLIVTDAFPLPVEGTETRCLADDSAIQIYMINLVESLEKTRKEKVMGWYHSHPFDVDAVTGESDHGSNDDTYNHCFLSGMDVQTQWTWQRNEDMHGNPWLALVIDPLHSIHRKRPEFGAFRVHKLVDRTKSIAPDGKKVTKETREKVIKRWGEVYEAFYSLEVSFFCNSLSTKYLHRKVEEAKAQRWYEELINSTKNAFSLFDAEKQLEALKEIREEASKVNSRLESSEFYSPAEHFSTFSTLPSLSMNISETIGNVEQQEQETEKKTTLDEVCKKLNQLVADREFKEKLVGMKQASFPQFY